MLEHIKAFLHERQGRAAAEDGRHSRHELQLAAAALMIEAVSNGYGVALGSFPLNDDLVREGNLVKPFDLVFDTGRAYYMVVSGKEAPRRAVRLFTQWLATQAEAPDNPFSPV